MKDASILKWIELKYYVWEFPFYKFFPYSPCWILKKIIILKINKNISSFYCYRTSILMKYHVNFLNFQNIFHNYVPPAQNSSQSLTFLRGLRNFYGITRSLLHPRLDYLNKSLIYSYAYHVSNVIMKITIFYPNLGIFNVQN